MYEIIDDYLIDGVGLGGLSKEENGALESALAALAADRRPASYGCRQEGDAWQIQIPCGGRKMLLGYEIYEKGKMIFLNYLKWDESSEEVEEAGWFRRWVLPLLDHKP